MMHIENYIHCGVGIFIGQCPKQFLIVVFLDQRQFSMTKTVAFNGQSQHIFTTNDVNNYLF